MTESSDYIAQLLTKLRSLNFADASTSLIAELDAAWDDGRSEGYGEGYAECLTEASA